MVTENDIIYRKYILNVANFLKPHPQPLSDGEGSIRPLFSPLSIGEGSGVRFCDIKYIHPLFISVKLPETISIVDLKLSGSYFEMIKSNFNKLCHSLCKSKNYSNKSKLLPFKLLLLNLPIEFSPLNITHPQNNL